jgi:hypothetical protein
VVDPYVRFYLAPVRRHLLIYYTFSSTYLVVQKEHTEGEVTTSIVWYHHSQCLSSPPLARLHIQTRPFNHPHCLHLIITSHRACAEEAPKHERFNDSRAVHESIDPLIVWRFGARTMDWEPWVESWWCECRQLGRDQDGVMDRVDPYVLPFISRLDTVFADLLWCSSYC